MSEANLLISTHDGVREITLNRPEKKNALDGQLFSALAEAMQQARQDDDVHVVMLMGAGGNFCSGMDLGGNFDDGSAPFDDCAAAMANFDKGGSQLHNPQIQRQRQRNQTPLIHPVSKNETFFLDY